MLNIDLGVIGAEVVLQVLRVEEIIQGKRIQPARLKTEIQH